MKVNYLLADAVADAAAKLLRDDALNVFANPSQDGSHWIVDHYVPVGNGYDKVQYRATFPFGGDEVVLVPLAALARLVRAIPVYVPPGPALLYPERARLDADGTAQPLTRLVSHPPREWCSGPGTVLVDPEIEFQDRYRMALT